MSAKKKEPAPNLKKNDEHKKGDTKNNEKGHQKVILLDGKRYYFNPRHVLLFVIATPLWVIILYQLLEYAAWIRIITADHTITSLNFITGMNATLVYNFGNHYYSNYLDLLNDVGAAKIFFSYVDEINIIFEIPGRGNIYFITFCTGFQAIIIFSGIIIFTPASLDKETSNNIWKRKTFTLLWSSSIFYIVNLARMWIQLDLYYLGYNWDDLHYSISAASSFIAVIIVLLMHKSLPEFVFMIMWTGLQIKDKYFPMLGYKKPKIVE
ncbi:MAG: archaeosortase H [Promethearchaeota archaeon]